MESFDRVFQKKIFRNDSIIGNNYDIVIMEIVQNDEILTVRDRNGKMLTIVGSRILKAVSKMRINGHAVIEEVTLMEADTFRETEWSRVRVNPLETYYHLWYHFFFNLRILFFLLLDPMTLIEIPLSLISRQDDSSVSHFFFVSMLTLLFILSMCLSRRLLRLYGRSMSFVLRLGDLTSLGDFFSIGVLRWSFYSWIVSYVPYLPRILRVFSNGRLAIRSFLKISSFLNVMVAYSYGSNSSIRSKNCL